MTVPIIQLLKQSFQLVKKDKIVFFPYLMFYFAVQSIQNIYFSNSSDTEIGLSVFYFIVIGFFIELFIKGYTLGMLADNDRNKVIKVYDSFILTFPKLIHLFTTTFTILLPFLMFMFWAMNSQADPTGSSNLVSFIFIVCLIPIGISIQFLPFLIVIDQETTKTAIARAFNLIKHYFSSVMMYTSLTITLSMLSLFTSVMFMGIPVLGRAVFQVVIQAFFSTLNMAVLWYYFQALNQSRKVDITVQDPPESKSIN